MGITVKLKASFKIHKHRLLLLAIGSIKQVSALTGIVLTFQKYERTGYTIL